MLGGILFLVSKPLIYRTRKNAQKITKLNKEIAHFVNENILGVKTVKSMSVGNRIIKKAKEHFSDFKKFEIQIYFYKSQAKIK